MPWEPGTAGFDSYIEAAVDQLLEWRGYIPAARNLGVVLPQVLKAAEERREREDLEEWPNERFRESRWTVNHAIVAALERRWREYAGGRQPEAKA